ncbi:MAG: hypothetical protein WC455_27960 [Dehalococcoidia bacterium]|jgi:hypothetical protein
MYKNMRQRQHFLDLAQLVKNDTANSLPEYRLVLVGEKIYGRLRHVERKAHRLAERECDDPTLTTRLAEQLEKRYIKEVLEILGYLPAGFFINGDPRGYALKIEEGYAAISYHDMGGYHILAPSFQGE